jgi:hypothetical protein
MINSSGEKSTSGPFNFLIARAQASADNPTGASLQLINPTEQAYLNYLYIAVGLILMAILVLLIIRSRKLKGIEGQ